MPCASGAGGGGGWLRCCCASLLLWLPPLVPSSTRSAVMTWRVYGREEALGEVLGALLGVELGAPSSVCNTPAVVVLLLRDATAPIKRTATIAAMHASTTREQQMHVVQPHQLLRAS